ncbi:hypothetical protein ACFV0R_32890, partial [Streptomyces sp. NPDC059578]|uniref:hypothetical protein n=1 Tax=Streptomyces sp. NPDC059578 TaxID=3346874 RepID=UPI0036B2293F
APRAPRAGASAGAGGEEVWRGAAPQRGPPPPLFLGTTPFPTYMFWLSMLMGVGFAIAGAGVLRTIAAQRSQARAHTSGGLG